MQPEQPNSPSEEVESPDAQSSESSSDQSEERTSSTPSWWQRMFHRGEPEPDPEDKADETPEDEASKPLTLTQEELDRRVQAETDRREAKRAAQLKAEQRKQLRDNDPWAYAEEERKAEQEAQSSQSVAQWFQGLSSEHDRVAIDPLIETLPQTERERILKMDGAGVGLQGRKLVVQESLKVLEKHWKTEGEKQAERKLRSNAAFRKQLLSEIRGQAVEPELLPSSASDNGRSSDRVNDMLRAQVGISNRG